MTVMTAKDLLIKVQMNRKVYKRKNGIFAVARYFNSKWWNPRDWYFVEIATYPGDPAYKELIERI